MFSNLPQITLIPLSLGMGKDVARNEQSACNNYVSSRSNFSSMPRMCINPHREDLGWKELDGKNLDIREGCYNLDNKLPLDPVQIASIPSSKNSSNFLLTMKI